MALNKQRFIYKDCELIDAIFTSHNSGKKKVISAGFSETMQVKQIAMGHLIKSEKIEQHLHPDMDEAYQILEGEGIMFVDEVSYKLYPGIFINVPAAAIHSLECTGADLKFIYFSLAIIS